jgi:GNAT superfamily N-acetyltransferase
MDSLSLPPRRRNVCGMSLRHTLVLALLAGIAGALVLAFDWDQRCVEAGVESASSTVPALVSSMHRPYLLVLLALAVVNLAALLLLRSAFREERCSALRRAQEAPKEKAAIAPGPSALDEDTALMGASATLTETAPESWGTIVPWSHEHENAFMELWLRACPRREGGWPANEAAFKRFFGSPEVDVDSSAAALSNDGRLLGAVVSLRQPAMEDEGYWWLEAPAVIGALVVDPAFRLKGIARALAQRAEERAKARHRPRIFAGGLENFPQLVPGVPGDDYASRMFFLSLGYREVRRTCHMEAQLDGYQVPPELRDREERLRADGYLFTPAKAEDIEAFRLFVERNNLDRPSRRVEKYQLGFERFYFVWKENVIAGYIQVTPVEENVGGLSGLYFSREHRGRGLGSVLLVKAHELWTRQSVRKAAIWTYPEAATRFYPRAGFILLQDWVQYEKELEHAWDDAAYVQRWR